jgi:uncharacterized protein YndB with AHSA1/START domain
MPEKENKPAEFVISRVFDAPRELLFKLWTEKEHLMAWFGPKGAEIHACKMDLRPGGVCHYGMRSADGHNMWGKWVFREIKAPERLSFVNSFSNEAGGLGRHPFNPDWPAEMLTTVTFADLGGRTELTVTWTPLAPTEAERKTFDAGHGSMRMGWGGTFDQLAAYVAKL